MKGQRHGHRRRHKKRNWRSQKCECYDGYVELRSWIISDKMGESGGNHKESPGKEVEVVWACDEKR